MRQACTWPCRTQAQTAPRRWAATRGHPLTPLASTGEQPGFRLGLPAQLLPKHNWGPVGSWRLGLQPHLQMYQEAAKGQHWHAFTLPSPVSCTRQAKWLDLWDSVAGVAPSSEVAHRHCPFSYPGSQPWDPTVPSFNSWWEKNCQLTIPMQNASESHVPMNSG